MTIPDTSGAREIVERLARAIAAGDLRAVNSDLHPRAVADLGRLAGEDDATPGPPIETFHVLPAGPGGRGEALFDVSFAAGERVTVLRLAAVRGAARWRVGRVVSVTVSGAGDP